MSGNSLFLLSQGGYTNSRSKPSGHLYLKTDPLRYCQRRPETSSIIANINKFQWDDQEWLIKREHENPLNRPVTIYEVHLGSWKRMPEENNRFLTYRELADQLIPYVKEMGLYPHRTPTSCGTPL